jgi:hypothetical protein
MDGYPPIVSAYRDLHPTCPRYLIRKHIETSSASRTQQTRLPHTRHSTRHWRSPAGLDRSRDNHATMSWGSPMYLERGGSQYIYMGRSIVRVCASSLVLVPTGWEELVNQAPYHAPPDLFGLRDATPNTSQDIPSVTASLRGPPAAARAGRRSGLPPGYCHPLDTSAVSTRVASSDQ